jgi:hypothetical protein
MLETKKGMLYKQTFVTASILSSKIICSGGDCNPKSKTLATDHHSSLITICNFHRMNYGA